MFDLELSVCYILIKNNKGKKINWGKSILPCEVFGLFGKTFLTKKLGTMSGFSGETLSKKGVTCSLCLYTQEEFSELDLGFLELDF